MEHLLSMVSAAEQQEASFRSPVHKNSKMVTYARRVERLKIGGIEVPVFQGLKVFFDLMCPIEHRFGLMYTYNSSTGQPSDVNSEGVRAVVMVTSHMVEPGTLRAGQVQVGDRHLYSISFTIAKGLPDASFPSLFIRNGSKNFATMERLLEARPGTQVKIVTFFKETMAAFFRNFHTKPQINFKKVMSRFVLPEEYTGFWRPGFYLLENDERVVELNPSSGSFAGS